MKVQSAIFHFRGWKFVFNRLHKSSVSYSDRLYVKWQILVFKGVKQMQVGEFSFNAFVPSASICRRILKKFFKKPISKKRIKQIKRNLQ